MARKSALGRAGTRYGDEAYRNTNVRIADWSETKLPETGVGTSRRPFPGRGTAERATCATFGESFGNHLMALAVLPRVPATGAAASSPAKAAVAAKIKKRS
jgi:hypothetical protein